MVVFAISQTFAPKWGSLGKIPDVGEIPKGLPVPTLPDVTLWPKMIAEVIPISVVAYSTNLSLGKLFAFKNNYTIDAMQEALAIGLANICRVKSLVANLKNTLQALRSFHQFQVRHLSHARPYRR